MRCVNRVLMGCMMVSACLTGCSTAPTVEPQVHPIADEQAQASTPAAPTPETPVKRTPSPNPYDQQAEPSNPNVRALSDKAISNMAKQQWVKAEPLLLQAIALAPNYSGLYYNLGRVYQNLNRPEDAATQYQNAIALNKNNIYAYNALAQLKRENGAFEEAETAYLQALAVWPDHAASHKNLGILYDLYVGKLPQALAQYQEFQALQETPDRLVGAWIVDLERRLASAAVVPENPPANDVDKATEGVQ